MKRTIGYVIGMAVLLLFQSCGQPQAMEEIGEEEVKRAVKELNEALVNPVKENLEALTAEDLTYGHSSGTLENQDEFITALVEGPFDFFSIDTSEESIVISGNTAVARHIMKAKGANNGEPVDVHIGILLVFQKKNGKLELLARQAYKL